MIQIIRIGDDLSITSDSTSFWNFQGNAVNIPENQNTSTSGYVSMTKYDSSGKVDLLRYKINQNGVMISVYQLNDAALQELIAKFKEEVNTGIRISNVLRTQCSWLSNSKSYIDTAWLWYQLTVDSGWSNAGRGFSPSWPENEARGYKAYATGSYAKAKTVANEFDNILLIPNIQVKKIKREIYVNHVDEQGNIIEGLQNSSQNMITPSGTTRESTGPTSGFQEHYTINGGETISISKSDVTKIGDTTYTFKNGKSAEAVSLSTAKSLLPNSSSTWTSAYKSFTTNPNKVDDCVVINLVYSKYTPLNIPIEIIGRLEFINTSSQYLGSTSAHDTDYIPATKQLTPFVQGAYPYVVKGIRYEPRSETLDSSATVTANISYKWDTWTYQHGNNSDNRELTCKISEHTHSSSCYDAKNKLTCTKTVHTHTNIWGSCYSHKHTSACDWYETTSTSSSNKVFNYNVPYKYTWFTLTNFKMYRISLLKVHDNEDNIGGTLFGGGIYTVNPSSTYEARFDNSRGIVPNTLTVTFPNKSYNLPEVYETLSKPTGGTETASNTSVNSYAKAEKAATDKLGLETNKTAADTTLLTITYQYDNDYVELDGTTDMLQRNYKTWSEHIIKETDESNIRDLDATKTGTGKNNGSALNYTSNLMSFMRPTTRLTTNSDFTPNYQTVPENRENGIRQLDGIVYYNITTDYKYNVGTNDFDSTDQTYKLNNTYRLSVGDFTEQSKVYEKNDVNKVNVLTPADFGDFELITVKKVDHTTGAGNSTILQKNADFTITPNTAASSTAGYNLSDTREFIKGYYFVFDFNILYNGEQVEAYTPIYLEGANSSITAKTTDSFSSGSAAQLTNSIKIVAITINITDALKTRFDMQVSSSYTYIDFINNKVRTSGSQNQKNLLTRGDIINDSYHAIYKIITTKNVGRIFDFAVTDCTDLAFKDVFRKPNAASINESTGVSYYSGYKKWNLYSTEYNEMIDRTDIGSNPQKILPLGPYKNTNTRYVNAPKMGYRISFDLKTTGFMAANNTNNSRRIEITPSYYYISKDGKTFDNNIKLYFKNSSGNYVNFASSGYTIYYKPNDGYRYLRNSMYTDDHTLMSTKLEPLTISTKLTLSNKMMSSNNTSFVQAWYGEFKLPNSTIAVSNVVGSPNNNLNNSYEDGYIGVIFDIKCIDTGSQLSAISYNTSDKAASSSTNTSQWDYEGFMNFKNPGSPTNTLRYQLEKNVWEIDNARYQQIKGTVVLFDIDNRAASDFE